MARQTPKTDWKIQPADENGRYNGDWFNIADYNRITGNIEVLYALAQELYPGLSIVNMPDHTVSDFPYASIINNIENKKSLPAMQSFFYICEYLGVTPKEFFDDENADTTALREFIQEARRLDEKSLEYILGIMKKLNSRK